MKTSTVFSHIDLSTPQGWFYAALIAIGGSLLIWLLRVLGERHNQKLGIDFDNLSIDQLAYLWAKNQIVDGIPRGLKATTILMAATFMAMILVVFTAPVIGLGLFFLGMTCHILITYSKQAKYISLIGMDKVTVKELNDYWADNRETVVANIHKDPEVIFALENMPKLLSKWIVRHTNRKSFKPTVGSSSTIR